MSSYNLYKCSEVIQYLCIGNRPEDLVYGVILVLFVGQYIRPKFDWFHDY